MVKSLLMQRHMSSYCHVDLEGHGSLLKRKFYGTQVPICVFCESSDKDCFHMCPVKLRQYCSVKLRQTPSNSVNTVPSNSVNTVPSNSVNNVPLIMSRQTPSIMSSQTPSNSSQTPSRMDDDLPTQHVGMNSYLHRIKSDITMSYFETIIGFQRS